MALAADHPKISEAEWRDFYALLKPRVMQLVVFTALIGLIIAPWTMNPILAFLSILCIAVGAGAAGSLNMWYEADIDAIMTRTKTRPIPSGKISREETLVFGLTLATISTFSLGLIANWVAASWLAFTIAFYVFYTIWLKRATPQNIVIGGAAGAFPPMIGWAAVTGSVTIEPIILFLIIFLWTPPHFWALALVKKGDYDAIGMPMMPNVAGIDSTRRQITAYSIVLALCGFAPFIFGFAGITYAIGSSVLNGFFVYYAIKLQRADKNDPAVFNKTAMRLFVYSIWYLFAIFGLLGLETIALRLIG